MSIFRLTKTYNKLKRIRSAENIFDRADFTFIVETNATTFNIWYFYFPKYLLSR